MSQIQNSTYLYSPNTIIVDDAGTTPFVTIAAGITAAVGLGYDTTIFVRTGTYTENLTLVEGINIQGEDKASTIIIGTHIIPATDTITLSNLTLQATGTNSIFMRFTQQTGVGAAPAEGVQILALAVVMIDVVRTVAIRHVHISVGRNGEIGGIVRRRDAIGFRCDTPRHRAAREPSRRSRP